MGHEIRRMVPPNNEFSSVKKSLQEKKAYYAKQV